MKRIVARVALAAVCLGLGAGVQATPIYFDFTGKIDGTGADISGGFNFETDRLLAAAGPPVNGYQYDFVDWQPTGLTEPFAFLSFGGREVAFPLHASNYSVVTFLEGCAEAVCAPGSSDGTNLFSTSSDEWTPDFTGTLRSSFIFVLAFGDTPLPDYPYWSGANLFDGATATPADIVTLPFTRYIGLFSESTQDCVAGACVYASDNQFSFSLDSVSRGSGARAVPEPGTLLLFAAGLAGLLFFGRGVVPGRGFRGYGIWALIAAARSGPTRRGV